MSATKNNNKPTNAFLVHVLGVGTIDDQTLAVNIPGGSLTLIFATRDVMPNTAAAIIAATDRPTPSTPPVKIDEVAVAFEESKIGIIPRIPEHAGKCTMLKAGC